MVFYRQRIFFIAYSSIMLCSENMQPMAEGYDLISATRAAPRSSDAGADPQGENLRELLN